MKGSVIVETQIAVGKNKSITNVSVEIFADGKIEFAGSDKQKKEMQQKLNNDQLNFDKSLVYVGGEKLENALRNGKWKNTSITSNISKNSAGHSADPTKEKLRNMDKDIGIALKSCGMQEAARETDDQIKRRFTTHQKHRTIWQKKWLRWRGLFSVGIRNDQRMLWSRFFNGYTRDRIWI